MRFHKTYKVYAVTRDSGIDAWDESTNLYTSSDVIIVRGFASRNLAESYVKGLPSERSVKLVSGAALRKIGIDPKNDDNWASILRPFTFLRAFSRAQVAEVDNIALSNAEEAFDQAGEYASLQEALDSYDQNAADTLLERGYDPRDHHLDRFQDAVRWVARASGFGARLAETNYAPEPKRPAMG